MPTEVRLPSHMVTDSEATIDNEKAASTIDIGNGKNKHEQEDTIYLLSKLTDIDDPKYAGKEVIVKAVIASNTTSYNIPKILHVDCNRSGQHTCAKEQDVKLAPAQIARYPDSRNREDLNEEFARQGFTKKCHLTWTETSDTLYRVRIRPRVTSLIFQDGKTVDESGVEYKHYDIFMIGKNSFLEPGSAYEINGVVIPDPRSQKVTLFATQLAKDASSEYELEKIKDLSAHLAKMNVKERVEWVQENFGKYSKVRKRRDVILCSFLTTFSPLYIHFDDKQERGWAISSVVGDSTTGKSEVCKSMIRLVNGGQYVVAETASMVGLSATAMQTTNGWFVEWGPLVLGDRRLVVVDGAQKLSKNDWSKLAESQRTGNITLNKAAKGEAHARTRQIIIANPVNLENYGTTKEMDSFLFPYLALATIMDIQSIARLDLAIFVNAGDVKAEEINITIDEQHDAQLNNLEDLRAFVWEGKYKIQYDKEFVKAIHEKATELYNKFHVSNVPLVSIDMKYKLVRLSTALALGTCSFNEELDTVTVTREHVEYVASFLDGIYTNAGLHEGATRERKGDVDIEQVQDIIDAICKKTDLEQVKVTDMVRWMGHQSSFSRDQVRSTFDLKRDSELVPLLSILQNEQVIGSSGRGFVLTNKGVKVVKLLIDN